VVRRSASHQALLQDALCAGLTLLLASWRRGHAAIVDQTVFDDLLSNKTTLILTAAVFVAVVIGTRAAIVTHFFAIRRNHATVRFETIVQELACSQFTFVIATTAGFALIKNTLRLILALLFARLHRSTLVLQTRTKNLTPLFNALILSATAVNTRLDVLMRKALTAIFAGRHVATFVDNAVLGEFPCFQCTLVLAAAIGDTLVVYTLSLFGALAFAGQIIPAAAVTLKARKQCVMCCDSAFIFGPAIGNARVVNLARMNRTANVARKVADAVRVYARLRRIERPIETINFIPPRSKTVRKNLLRIRSTVIDTATTRCDRVCPLGGVDPR